MSSHATILRPPFPLQMLGSNVFRYEENSMSKIGQFIRKRREAQDMSLSQLCRMIGVSQTYGSYIENGKVPPSPAFLVKAAAVLGIDSDELLARAGKLADDVRAYIQKHPEAVKLLRRAMKRTAKKR